MSERNWIVGSAPNCDLRVESPIVSGRHCRLTQRGAALLLEDLGSTNGTFVAGERVTGPRIVHRGDPVTLGRDTPLPWPPPIDAITIGRLPDNDVVIPLDMISGHHARLEREGDTVYLVDTGSSNGTAVGDLLNKITRTAIHPTDQVFLGTHEVAAAELFKALPKYDKFTATIMERNAPAERAGNTSLRQPAEPPRATSIGSAESWAWGIGLSVVCAGAILGGARAFGPDTTADVSAESAEENIPAKPSATSDPTSTSREPIVPPPALDEDRIRQSAGAVVLIGLRTNDLLAVYDATGWALRPDEIICPTKTLELMEQMLVKKQSMDESLVVFNRNKTIAILSHVPGRGAADGFSLAKLEAPLDATCRLADDIPVPLLDQELAVLSGECQDHDPRTFAHRFLPVNVRRIERTVDKSPTVLYCKSNGPPGELLGAPVFSASGDVVGCVGPSATGVKVITVAQLADLFKSNP